MSNLMNKPGRPDTDTTMAPGSKASATVRDDDMQKKRKGRKAGATSTAMSSGGYGKLG